MGYHSNEETTKKAINDAQRFINDRARLEHALRIALKKLSVSDCDQEKIISDVRSCNFDSINAVNEIVRD
jgi:SOS response regulatory protein OraA/RecX